MSFKSLPLGKGTHSQQSLSQRLWIFAIVGVCIVVGFLVPTLQAQSYPHIAIATILALPVLFVVFSNWQLKYLVLVLFLPFIQALSVKLGPRWAVSEILGWLLLPTVLIASGSVLFSRTRQILISLWFYSLFASIFSLLVIVPSLGILRPHSLTYFYSPAVRTLMENARFAAAITVVLATLLYCRNPVKFTSLLRAFVIGGGLAAAYGIYHFVQIAWLSWLPLLPGTSSSASIRAWGSFYEPTGYGSFCVPLTFAALFLLKSDSGKKRIVWALVAIAALLGIFLSVSTVAWIALAVGVAAALSISLFYGRKWLVAGFFVFVIFAGFLLDFLIGNLGTSIFWRNLSVSHALYRIEHRISSFFGALDWLWEIPIGLGQGMAIFYLGGVAGIIRWITEMGIPGLMLTLAFHVTIMWAFLRSWRRPGLASEFAPFGAAIYCATLIASANYIYPTHSWIWFCWSLPLAAAAAAAVSTQRRAQN